MVWWRNKKYDNQIIFLKALQAGDILKYFPYFSQKIGFHNSCKLSTRKCFRMSSATILNVASRVSGEFSIQSQ